MANLPLANILHYKLRSVLSALGIAIGICMLVTLSGLSRGSLDEVADRWESVDADLIVYPRGWGDNITTISGIGVSDRIAAKLLADYGDIVQRVVPVFLWQVKLGGQDQLAVGVDSDQWPTLTGGRSLRQGRLFDPQRRFAAWIETLLLTDGSDKVIEVTEQDLAAPAHNGLELVIDSRLAAAGHYALGQSVRAANHDWTIVGIVPAGAMSRVFLPRRTAQFLFGSGDITRSTLQFVKLRGGVDADSAARRLRGVGQEVVQLRQYRAMLQRKFGVMYRYVDAVNGIAMVIAFLFITTTLYTMVLQRTREIAILKSFGAGKGFILRQVLAESALLTALGFGIGIALSFAAARAIEAFAPLYTVTIQPIWLGKALLIAAAGATVSALYPAWRAMRVDMVETLTLE